MYFPCFVKLLIHPSIHLLLLIQLMPAVELQPTIAVIGERWSVSWTGHQI